MPPAPPPPEPNGTAWNRNAVRCTPGWARYRESVLAPPQRRRGFLQRRRSREGPALERGARLRRPSARPPSLAHGERGGVRLVSTLLPSSPDPQTQRCRERATRGRARETGAPGPSAGGPRPPPRAPAPCSEAQHSQTRCPPRCPYSSPCHSVPQDPRSQVPPGPCTASTWTAQPLVPRSDLSGHSLPLHWVTQGTLGTQNYSIFEPRAAAPTRPPGPADPTAPASVPPPARDPPLPLRGHRRALVSEDTWPWPCAAPTWAEPAGLLRAEARGRTGAPQPVVTSLTSCCFQNCCNLLSVYRPPFPTTPIPNAQLLPDAATLQLTSLSHSESGGHRCHQATKPVARTSSLPVPSTRAVVTRATLPRRPTPQTSRRPYRKLGGSPSSLQHEPRPLRDGLTRL